MKAIVRLMTSGRADIPSAAELVLVSPVGDDRPQLELAIGHVLAGAGLEAPDVAERAQLPVETSTRRTS